MDRATQPTHHSMRLKPHSLVVGLLALTLLSACASERVKEQARKEKANKDQYVDYYPVGSNIPIKIPKDDARVSEQETERTQEIFPPQSSPRSRHPAPAPRAG